MAKLRATFSVIGIIAAPFAVLIVIFLIVHAITYDGTGPDDGAGMLASVIAFPIAIITAIALWTVSLLRLIVWLHRQWSEGRMNTTTGSVPTKKEGEQGGDGDAEEAA